MNLKKFLSRIPDINLVQKYAKRLNTIAGITIPDLTHLSYRLLKKELPSLIEEQKYEEAILLVLKSKKNNLTLKRVKRIDNYKKLKFLFWIQDQYVIISELEQAKLASPPDAKLIAAGIKELDILGDKNLIDALAGGDILKWDKVEQLPYSMIFEKQLKNTIEARIHKKLNKVK